MSKSSRYFRTLLSALFTLACLLLICAWMRSYLRFDQFAGPWRGSSYAGITSVEGQITFQQADAPVYGAFLGPVWKWRGFRMSDWGKAGDSDTPYFPADRAGRFFTLSFRQLAITRDAFAIPYWMLILATAALASLPWISPRFSLRSLVVATTLAALFFGFAVDWSPQFPPT